ncbi:RNA recognition motif 2-domain-containing protein, partial [Podospora appendiculata]
MAQARETAFNPPSPHSSSGGADSYKHEGTPDTRLTAFSPDENSARSNKILKALSLNASVEQHPVRFHVKSAEGYRAAQTAAEKDPFISSTTAPKAEQKLSPTASSFRPVSVPLIAHGSLGSYSSLSIGPSADLQHLGAHFAAKPSTQLHISRYLVIFSTAKPVTVASVDDYLTKLERLGFPRQGKCQLVSEGAKVYLQLTNIRDALNIHGKIHFGSPEWCADYVSPFDFWQVAKPGEFVDPVTEGQVYVIALPVPGVSFSAPQAEVIVHGFLRGEGEIFAFQRQSEYNDTAFRALVEFDDVDVAVAVASKFNGFAFSGIQLLLTLCQPPDTLSMSSEPLPSYTSPRAHMHDITDGFQNMAVSKTPQPARTISGIGRPGPGQSPLGMHLPQQQLAMYPLVYSHVPQVHRYLMEHTPTRSQSVAPLTPTLSPMNGNMPIVGPMYTPPSTPMTMQGDYASPRGLQAYGRPDSRRQNAMRVNRSPYFNAAGHHNHVDVNRIREGIDVRTTIMLRNIPNKVDQAMLKRIVDESSWGKYDFMYLRIDFANDCNVGYAFINFVDPLDIIDFVNARGNQRWNCFKSDKVAEISYASKDCLVQKFRNSSVMLEAPHYRPKLYFTSNGPRPELAGEEEQFPEPDNQSKMKRSCENAEHVGLFTPNAGQHFRDEQRRRRSQYDRGTRLAALEEYDYDAHIQQQGLYASQ